MNIHDKEFVGSIPEFYDQFLVPLIFECCAENLAIQIGNLEPKSILETASGTGVLCRALAPILSKDTKYIVSDLNQPMLEYASLKQPPDLDGLSFQTADALKLPFSSNEFDLVACQFGVMFYPDRVLGFKEARRVLKSGGSMVFNVWDKIEENKFADIVTRAATEIFPDNPPRFLQRTPHGYHDVHQVEQDLRSAGFTHISHRTNAYMSGAKEASIPAIAYCHGTPLRNELEQRNPELICEVIELATEMIKHEFGTGPVEAKIQEHVFVAR